MDHTEKGGLGAKLSPQLGGLSDSTGSTIVTILF